MDRKNLLALGKATAKASLNPSATFSFGKENLSYEALNETFRKELNDLAGTYREYCRNKNDIFELMETVIDEVLPAKILQSYGQFAEVKQFAQGDKPTFRVKVSEASKRRARGFITRVGLAGRYETFRLDGYSFEIATSAWGGAAAIGFEEFLDSKIQMSDVLDIVLEGLDDAVYKEIAKGLEAMVSDLPAVNTSEQNTFVESEFDKLLFIADVYGHSTIYCTFEFASKMIPADSALWSDSMKQTKWENGAFTTYKKHSVVILPQSFEDETNTTKVIDPSKAYIIPTGAAKPVHVAFEGQSAVREVEDNDDWSRDIQTYRKFGVAVYNTNPGICVYTNKSLTKTITV